MQYMENVRLPHFPQPSINPQGYYMCSNKGFNRDNCLSFVYLSSETYTVTTVTAVQFKYLI